MTINQPAPPPPAPEQQQGQAAPKKSSLAKRIGGVVVGLIVAAGVAYAFNYFGSDAAQTKAGDCASITGSSSKPEFTTVGCEAPEANYIIGKVLESNTESCGDNYDEYTETSSRGPDSKLCLVPKLVSGECHDVSGSGMGYPVVDCSATGALKVTTVNDEAECTEGEALAYTEPKTIYCLAPPTDA
jgi:hypothetical protein